MTARIFHAHLWGDREGKYQALREIDVASTPWAELQPNTPYYLFVPQDSDLLAEYQRGWKVTEVFPVNSVGIVTARDHLTIRWSGQEILDTLRHFSSLTEEEAREHYQLGRDVQDWQVGLAQEDVKLHGIRSELVAPVLYRPFDARYTYYTGQARGFLCRPRPEVMRHMLAGENLGFLTTRQTRDKWDISVTRLAAAHKSLSAYDITSLFPLYLYPGPEGEKGQQRSLFGGTGFEPVPEALTIHRRDLPHWQIGGSTYFLTFRLQDGPGSQPLSQQERALVKQAILFWQDRKWRVHLLTVMPDHVHILATPLETAPGYWHSLSEILHSVKRQSAREINQVRARRGRLWQSETFDRILRNQAEYDEKAQYILSNAVKNGLVADGWLYDGFWCETGGAEAGVITQDRILGHQEAQPEPDITQDRILGHQEAQPEPGSVPRIESPATRRPNLSPEFIAEMEGRLGLRFVPEGRGAQDGILGHQEATPAYRTGSFGPEDVFYYAYAVFHSPTYRSRYAEFLKIDFPRLPLTSDRALFAALAEKGGELAALHLLESSALEARHMEVWFGPKGSDIVDKVTYQPPKDGRQGRVAINQAQGFEGIAPEVWEFHVGGYQVCEKWLKDRKGRVLTYEDQKHYQKIVVALGETLRLMAEIDATIPSWPIT